MKKIALILSCTMIISCGSFSQQSVEDALKSTYQQFNAASDQSAMTNAANRFSLIATKWDTDWAAQYYAAYAKTILAAIDSVNKRKSALFEEAEKYLDKAIKNGASENDEVYALAAMIASMKIGLEPDAWQKHLEVFMNNLKKAKQLRKENPRIYYIEGVSKFYTPEAYGGGKQAALIYFKKAEEYFILESDSDIRKPFWGKAQNADMIKRCSE